MDRSSSSTSQLAKGFRVPGSARVWPTTYGYDSLDRETGELFLNGERVTWDYFAAGRRTLMGDLTDNTEYAIDVVGRECAVLNPTGHRLTYGLDQVGNRLTMDAANDPPGRCRRSPLQVCPVHLV